MKDKKILFKLEEINPFPFIKRYQLFDKNHKYIGTFRKIEDFEYFIKYIKKNYK